MGALGTNFETISPEMIASLQKMLSGESRLSIISAYLLSKDELAAIKKNLFGSDDPKLLVENTVDPSILGGLIIKTDSRFYDYSLKGKLSVISQKLNL